MKCNVCGTEENIAGVACSGLGPFSFCYCVECARRGREPELAFAATLEMVGTDVADHVRGMRTISDGKELTWDEWVSEQGA